MQKFKEKENKIVAIMQPYIFPYIGYWQLINAVDTFVLYDDVNFIKNGWINRNYILLNGKKHLFTIPLKGISSNKQINQIKSVDGSGNNNRNREKFLKMIEYAYQKAPFYNDVVPLIEKSLYVKENSFVDIIYSSIISISKYLEMDTNFILSSEIEKNNSLKGQDKVISICKILNAEKYINSIGGCSLYDKNIFEKHGIELKFLRPHDISYNQFNNEFVQNLSIVDILMFNSIAKIRNFLNEYTLI